MAIYDLYSKRQKRARGEFPDVYQYDDISKKFRIQVIQIMADVIGNNYGFNEHTAECYNFIHQVLCKEYGQLSLTTDPNNNYDDVTNFFLNCDDHERCFDVIEISFRVINAYTNGDQHTFGGDNKQSLEGAIADLNIRFKESGLGYQFESNKIIRIDSEFAHAEVVKPVLQLLGADEMYAGANQEFLNAHEHYRDGNHEGSITDSLKCFESTMKVICDKHKWEYPSNATSNALIKLCLSNNLIPRYLDGHFRAIQSLLNDGLPAVRNKEAAHGNGSKVREVPGYIASYALHLTATNVLFLAKAEQEL